MNQTKPKISPSYILNDVVLEKYYYFYTYNKTDEVYYSFCVERYDTPPKSSDNPVLKLLKLENNWDPNINYDILLANSVYRQLERCDGDVVIINRNIVAIKSGSEKKLYYVHGTIENAKLFVIINDISDITIDKNVNASWAYQKKISNIFRSINRNWNDKFLDDAKLYLIKSIKNILNYETVKKNKIITDYETIIKNEKYATSILEAERLMFDRALFLHAAKDLESDISRVINFKIN